MSMETPTEPQNGASTKTRRLGAGLSAVGAAAGAGGLAYSGKKFVSAAKKVGVKGALRAEPGAALLAPLEVAGLGGEVLATHILHQDTKRQGTTVNKSAATQRGRRIVDEPPTPAPVPVETSKALLGKLIKPAVKTAEAAPKPKSLAQMRDEARGSLNSALNSKGTIFTPVGKAGRRFDPEADRQRRLGTYAGLAGGASLVAAHEGGRRMTFNKVPGEVGGTRKLGFVPKKGKVGLLATGASLGLAGLGAAAYRRGVSERNQPWT
jgi:hypothetical protein